MSPRSTRQLHLYLGCLFAPLIIYFCLTGAWQLFRFNDLPKNAPASAVRTWMHEASKAHTNSTFPGMNPKTDSSSLFNFAALLMALGMITTTFIGIKLAFTSTRQKRVVWILLGAGILIPVLMLYFR